MVIQVSGQKTSSSKTCIYVSERFFLDIFASEDLGKMMKKKLEEHIFVAVGWWEKTATRWLFFRVVSSFQTDHSWKRGVLSAFFAVFWICHGAFWKFLLSKPRCLSLAVRKKMLQLISSAKKKFGSWLFICRCFLPVKERVTSFLHVISTSSCAFFGWEVCQSFGLQPPTMSHYKFLREDQRPIISSSPQGRVNCIQYLIAVSFILDGQK